MAAIPLNRAAEMLGKTVPTLMNTPRYMRFHIRSSEGSKDAKFDLESYLKEQDHRVETIEKLKLFVEYLRHIEGVSYAEMSRITGVSVHMLNRLEIGYDHSIAIITKMNRDLIDRFDKYYGWKTK